MTDCKQGINELGTAWCLTHDKNLEHQTPPDREKTHCEQLKDLSKDELLNRIVSAEEDNDYMKLIKIPKLQLSLSDAQGRIKDLEGRLEESRDNVKDANEAITNLGHIQKKNIRLKKMIRQFERAFEGIATRHRDATTRVWAKHFLVNELGRKEYLNGGGVPFETAKPGEGIHGS